MSAVLHYAATASTFFLVPFYLIQGREFGPVEAGFVPTAQPIVMATTASFSGAFSDRIGSRPPATAGMALLALGLFRMSRLGEATPFVAVACQQRGVASGILATARTLGFVLGIGLAGAVFNTVLHHGEATGLAAVDHDAGVGLLVAAAIAVAGALTSATRPDPGAWE